MDPKPKNYAHNIPAARNLRRTQTPSESLLWEALRDRRLAGVKFRRQHAVGRYVLDFFAPALLLAIEVDGSVHNDPDQSARDRERQTELEQTGIRFHRIPAHNVESRLDQVIEELTQLVSELRHP